MDEKTFLKKLGENIKRKRIEKNMSQVELGDLCDSEKSSINRIESGRTNPTTLTLKKVAEALSTPIEELFKFEKKTK